jgi:mannose-1-phosphate guanylyltransferase
MINVYTVILAGGRGKRLWPLSRRTLPKQLIPFIDGKTLLDLTIERVALLSDYDKRWLVTVEDYVPAIRAKLHEQISYIVQEPCSRNTAPAITLVAATIYKQDPEAVIFFAPSDHLITDVNSFVSVAQQALMYAAENDDLVLLGIKPTYPDTEYGYIEYMTPEPLSYPVRVSRFHEKPSKESAERYCSSPTMVWNSGMICAKASVFIRAIERHAPVIYNGVQHYLAEQGDAYAVLPDCSFDHGILEYAENLVLFPAAFDWSDVGNLASFITAYNRSNKNARIIEIDAHRNMVFTQQENKKLVVISGVDDLSILYMNDLLFITNRGEADRIKTVLDYLQKQGCNEYL